MHRALQQIGQVTRAIGRRRRPVTVRTYLAGVATLVLLTAVGATVHAYRWNADRERTAALDNMAYRAQRGATLVSASLAGARSTVAGLASSPGIAEALQEGGDCLLQVNGDEAFRSIRLDLIRTDARITCSSDPTAATGRVVDARSPWVAETLAARAPRVHWDAEDLVEAKAAVVVSAAVRTSGRPVGVAAAVLPSAQIGPNLSRALSGPQNLQFLVVDLESRRVVSSGGPGGKTTHVSQPPPSSSTGSWRPSPTSGDQLFASADLEGAPWRVYVTVSEDSVLAGSRAAFIRHSLAVLAAGAILLAGLALLDRRVARPLRRVTDALACDDGTRDHAPEVGTAEVVALARELNRLVDVRNGHEARLSYNLSHDSLTRLPNRTVLRQRIEHAASTSDAQLTMIVLGIDRFKRVNDALGQDAGDRVLVAVAERLSAFSGRVAVLARLTGDEFAALVKGAPVELVRELCLDMLAAVSAPLPSPTGELVVKARAGITTTCPEVGEGRVTTVDRLLREASAALRHAKLTGQILSEYDATLDVGASYQLEIERGLRRALQRDELTVHYQPLVSLPARVVGAAEALVRWNHPERGFIPPMEFIPAAETSGQIIELGAYVLDHACRTAAQWADLGHPLRMSVNVAVAQLEQSDFPQTVTSCLARWGLRPELLCLEITESALIDSGGPVLGHLRRLRESGVHVAIDDFGTGYSSLAYLRQLPADEIKIDRAFIARLDVDSRDRQLVRAMITMARALDLTVVAEGVESPAQVEHLAAWGCGTAQGFLFSPPQTAERFVDLFITKRNSLRTSA